MKPKTKKLVRTDGGFEWGNHITTPELRLIIKIAKKACRRSKYLAKRYGGKAHHAERGPGDLMMDLELCHVKHHKLRLKEMAETKDYFSFMHDINMIVESLNRRTYGWEGVGMPRFSA